MIAIIFKNFSKYVVLLFFFFNNYNAALADSYLSRLKVGQSYSGEFKLPFVKVPLPVGEWTLTSANETRNNNNNVILEVTLAKFDSNIVFEWLTLITNVDMDSYGYVTFNDCERKDVVHVVKKSNYPHEQDCHFVNSYVFQKTNSYNPAIGMSLRDYARKNNLSFPHTTLTEGIRLSNKNKFLTALRYINTAALGFANDQETTWSNSPWHRDLIDRDPKRVALVKAIVADLENWYIQIKSRNSF